MAVSKSVACPVAARASAPLVAGGDDEYICPEAQLYMVMPYPRLSIKQSSLYRIAAQGCKCDRPNKRACRFRHHYFNICTGPNKQPQQ